MRRLFIAGILGASLCSQAQQATPQAPASEAKSIVIPAGTKVLLQLRSGINTKTAQPGDGVYLTSGFPVVVGDHVAIPAGVYVQGVIDQVTRPGRIKGRATVRMHFTSMIFPNGSVVTIPGVVNSLPGSDGPRVRDEGNIEQAGNQGRDAGTIAQDTIAGATLGTIGGAGAGAPGKGAALGGLTGAAVGLISTMITRGDEVVLPAGQSVEMVLQRPLTITQADLTGPDMAGQPLVPSAQPPLSKPKHVFCPAGSPGCNL